MLLVSLKNSVKLVFHLISQNRTSLVNLESIFSQPACVTHVVLQGSILVFLYTLMKCYKLSNIIFFFMLIIDVFSVNIKGINEIEKQLNKEFESICDWFVDNKLSNPFLAMAKTKSILFCN